MFKRNSQIEGTGYGANNIAYLPDTTFPLFNFFGRGGIVPGIAANFHWSILQPNRDWVQFRTRVIGNPGIQNGMMIGQPMIDTRGINGV